MSHVSCVNMVIKDLNILQKVAAELGLAFMAGQKTFKWFGRWVKDYHDADAAYKNGIKPEDYGKCEHALAIPGNDKAYEIGVVKMEDGTYRLVWDFFGQSQTLVPLVGNKGEKLLQGYAKEVAVQALAKKGYKEVQSEFCPKTGKLKVTLRSTV